MDYKGATDVTLTFDLKVTDALTATALHLQTNMPGAGVINNFDIQNGGLNDTTWTGYSFDFTGVDASMGSNLSIHFNMAAGAVIGSGGGVLVDNVELKPTE